MASSGPLLIGGGTTLAILSRGPYFLHLSTPQMVILIPLVQLESQSIVIYGYGFYHNDTFYSNHAKTPLHPQWCVYKLSHGYQLVQRTETNQVKLIKLKTLGCNANSHEGKETVGLCQF